MASGIKVRINSAGAEALLTSAGVLSDVSARASAVAAAANARASPDTMDNPAYMSDSEVGSTRARARVFTATPHGIHNNNKYDTLLSSLYAGG